MHLVADINYFSNKNILYFMTLPQKYKKREVECVARERQPQLLYKNTTESLIWVKQSHVLWRKIISASPWFSAFLETMDR